MEWTQCPQCGLAAEVVDRDVWPSTDGPIEHLHVRCVARHRFVLPAATLELHHLQHREPAGRELVLVRGPRRGEPRR